MAPNAVVVRPLTPGVDLLLCSAEVAADLELDVADFDVSPWNPLDGTAELRHQQFFDLTQLEKWELSIPSLIRQPRSGSDLAQGGSLAQGGGALGWRGGCTIQ